MVGVESGIEPVIVLGGAKSSQAPPIQVGAKNFLKNICNKSSCRSNHPHAVLMDQLECCRGICPTLRLVMHLMNQTHTQTKLCR